MILFLITCLISIGVSENERIIPIQQVRFFEDNSASLSFEDVIQSDSLFRYKTDFIPSEYNVDAAYWVFYDFCIEDSLNKYVLEFYDQTIDLIDVYIQHNSDSLFRHYQFGDQFVFKDRKVDHKNFQVKLNRAGRYIVYVRISNSEYSDIRVAIKSIDRFIEYSLSEYFLYGIFYGMILIISFYNLFVFVAIREVKYIYYTMYIISVGIFAMCVDGIAFQLLWPKSPGWNQIADGIALFSLIVFAILFSKRFLYLTETAPRTDLILNIVLVVRIIVFLYALFFDNSVFNLRYIEIFPLSIIFFSSIYVFLNGYKPARFFILAYGFLFLGFILKALILYSYIPLSWTLINPRIQIISYYSLHICFILEMLFLTLALSDRIRILKEDQDLARKETIAKQEELLNLQNGINKKLEVRIKERTEEIARQNILLFETNQILETQKKEISKINTLLDLDNWKLRNNLKSVQKSRLLNIKMSYKDFIEIFRNQNECLKFLAEHKWKNGFHCKRCTNSKYLDGNSAFSKRCTKCGYTETPTADTLFHGIRFPLQKAFYILYLILYDQNTHSLNELSAEIDLRKNTVWSFRKKVIRYIEQNGSGDLDIYKDLQNEEIYN